MEFNSVLRSRHSVRKFSSKDLSWADLTDILEAGTLAPSSGNVQNWVFIVLRKREVIEKVVASLSREQSWAAKASVLVVVCSDVAHVKELYGARGEALYGVQNCAASIENMLLKATDLGIGSCWIGYFDEKEIGSLLAIGGDVRPQAILAFGYGESIEEKPREPLQNCVFFERYGNRTREVGLWPLTDSVKRIVHSAKEKVSKLKK